MSIYILRLPTLVDDPVEEVESVKGPRCSSPKVEHHARLRIVNADHGAQAEIRITGKGGRARGGVLDRVDAVEVIVHAATGAIADADRPTVGVGELIEADFIRAGCPGIIRVLDIGRRTAGRAGMRLLLLDQLAESVVCQLHLIHYRAASGGGVVVAEITIQIGPRDVTSLFNSLQL